MGLYQIVRKRVFLLFFTSAILLFGTGHASAQIRDIAGHWAEEKMRDWIEKGYIRGYSDGSFKPDASITRAEFITLLNQSFRFTEESAVTYRDVKQEDWFYHEVRKANAAGYLAGYPDKTIKPNHTITRQEAAVILAVVAKGTATNKENVFFKDKNEIAGWSADAVTTMAQMGVLHGYPDGTFKPQNKITRAESIVAISQLLLIQNTPAQKPTTIQQPPAPVSSSSGSSDHSDKGNPPELIGEITGPLTITNQYNGKVLSQLTKVQGNVTIEATNLTLKNVRITGDVTMKSTSNITFVDVIVEGKIMLN